MGLDESEAPIRGALAALAAAQEGVGARPDTGGAGSGGNRPSLRVRVLAGMTAIVLVGMVAIALARLAAPAVPAAQAAAPSRSGSCSPITYDERGPATAHTRVELAAAIAEMEQRTGVSFTPAASGPGTLVIEWSHAQLPVTPASSGATSGWGRPVAYGAGSWRDTGGRVELSSAIVAVDVTRGWTYGLDRGDSLAAALVHELGHVFGLPHNPEPTSFMHATIQGMRPQWTAGEIAALTGAGERAGCRRAPEGPSGHGAGRPAHRVNGLLA